MFENFNIQFFADAGDVLNGTGGYTNSSTGVVTNFSGINTLTAEMKDFYDTTLLENTRHQQYFAQFGKKQPLPKNHKGTCEWRKWNTFAPAGKLQEGVIPTGQKFGITNLTGSIDQYGTYTAITDKLELRSYDDIILGASEEMSASAAETQEKLIRDKLLVGTNVLYCDNLSAIDGDTVSGTPTAQKGMGWDATNGYSELTPKMVNKAVTILKKNRVPKINGKYYAVIHPSVAFNLRESKGWIEAHKYGAPEQLFNGEIGELHGVRFIENEFAPVINGADLASDSRTLLVNGAISSSSSTITFDGGTVAADALKGRFIIAGGNLCEVTGNTPTTITIKTAITSLSDNAVIYPGEGNAVGGAVYPTYFFGQDSFGIIDPEGGALEMIVHDKSEIGGPLNQYSTIGYKFESNGATILYSERMLRVMCCSSFSDTDEAN